MTVAKHLFLFKNLRIIHKKNKNKNKKPKNLFMINKIHPLFVSFKTIWLTFFYIDSVETHSQFYLKARKSYEIYDPEDM